MSKNKFASGVRKVLDNTVGAVGFGFGFGAAYAAEIPVVGEPIKSLNNGVAKGYDRAQVRILAGKIVDGKTTVEVEMAKLDGEARARLADEVERVKAGLKSDESVDPKTGEITPRPNPGFGEEFLGGAQA